VPFETTLVPTSPWVLPGTYTVRLTVDGKTSTQPLTVAMDPRVKTPPAGLEEQFRLSMKAYAWMQQLTDDTLKEAAASLLESLQAADTAPSQQLVEAVQELERKVQAPRP